MSSAVHSDSHWKIQDGGQKYRHYRTKHNPEKQTMQNTAKQNHPGHLPFTTHGHGTRWAYSTVLPHTARLVMRHTVIICCV